MLAYLGFPRSKAGRTEHREKTRKEREKERKKMGDKSGSGSGSEWHRRWENRLCTYYSYNYKCTYSRLKHGMSGNLSAGNGRYSQHMYGKLKGENTGKIAVNYGNYNYTYYIIPLLCSRYSLIHACPLVYCPLPSALCPQVLCFLLDTVLFFCLWL